MYAINPIIKLPQNLLLSDVMHNVKTHFALPENIKETYYENASPNSCHEVRFLLLLYVGIFF